MAMKKFLNDPADLTTELLEGLVCCHSDRIRLAAPRIVVRVNPKCACKVAVVTLGGSGHEPALSGFVGEGMLDASVVGDIFAAPGAPKLFEALKLLSRPAGILLVTLNHNGDRMSANKALRMAQKEGLLVKEIVVHEDIAQGPGAAPEDRRGLGGCIPLIKVVGAAAEAGMPLDRVAELGGRFNDGMATLSVALRTATHPQNGGEIGSIGEGDMEVGMGQHGEGGGGVMPVKSADETAEIMVGRLIQATGLRAGDGAFLAINGSGATTPMEQFIVYRRAAKILEGKGIRLMPGIVDELLTVQEMAGFQMILCRVDTETACALRAKSNAPYWVCNG